MIISIDTENIARLMVEYGIRPSDIKAGEFDSYTDTLVDALEQAHELESHVTEAIKNLEVCPNCEGIDWDWQDNSKICNNCKLEF